MRLLASLTSIPVLLGLSGCGTSPILKPEGHIKSEAPRDASQSPIPPTIRPVPLPPPPEPRAAEVKYSVVVANQSVRDVLLAIARETRVNVDVHPGVEGYVTLNAIDQTLKQILTRISKQIDMRYEIEGQTIMVMPDAPFLKSYRVDYVNMSRDVTETVGIATQIISGQISTGGAGGAGAVSGTSDNNSTLRITNVSRHRFWESLEKNIKDLLRETDKLLPEGSSETFVQGRGQGTVASNQRASAPARRNASTANPAAQAAGAVNTAAGVLPTEAVTQQSSEYVEQRLTFREASSVIVSPEAGIVTVRATGRQQERIAEFLEQVVGSAKRQVLIEATVVEVELNDSYQSGVDWSALGIDGLGYTIRQNFLGANPNLGTTPFFQLSYSNPNAAAGGNLSSTVKLLSSFGNTKVLSSPKIMVLNNQTAVLKVVDNRVYFTIQANTVPINQNQSTTTFTTTQNIVPIGFIMNVTPQISEGDMVTLNVRPTVTKILGFVNDPNPSLPSGVVNRIPETQSREMESVLKVGSGQTAVLGGLMTDSFIGIRDGLPIGSRIPIIGDLMSQRNDTAKKSELIIFIRPLVIKDANILTDLAGYQRYVPGTEFFKDTQPPVPELQEGLMKMQRGEMPLMKPNPVVPDPVPAESPK
jgi:MSHA biogenesis protein MshL